MRLGVDSYSYHRLLGEVRPGEDDPGDRFTRGVLDVLAECRRLGVEVASLETCFLDPPEGLDVPGLRQAARELELVLAWGHPHGLELGRRPEPLAELRAWIATARELGVRLVRIVAGSPRFRPRGRADLERTATALREACGAASDAGIALALENHADLRAVELAELLELVGSPALGVCFDTANALRVGDDPVAAARTLARAVAIVHLKDCGTPTGPDPPGPVSCAYAAGVVDVDSVLETLEAAGFQGPVCVELGHLGPGPVDERTLVAECLDWLVRRRDRRG